MTTHPPTYHDVLSTHRAQAVMPPRLGGFLYLLCLLFCGDRAWADTSAELDYFENEIRPVLVERCINCHGPRRAEAGLRLDQRATLLRGGDSGPAAVVGEPDRSLLIHAIRHRDGLEMPPEKELDTQQIAAFERWIADGVAWPSDISLAGTLPGLRAGPISAAEREFWSFQPIKTPPPPRVEANLTCRNPIDHFVSARLIDEGLTMRSAADKRTLLRRATLDLTGLPPTFAEIAAFIEDERADSFSNVVERLLASPAYGERWGRHWLDVVRYADTAGETADYPVPLAWKYRNWVIKAFQADMPYDRFIQQQIAGDLLARELIETSNSTEVDSVQSQYSEFITATGFIAISRRFGFDVENYHYLTIQDTIDTIGGAVLGLSLGCARCHDHKYDPITVHDYYAWYGIFSSTRYSFPGSEEKKRPYDLLPALSPQLVSRRQTQFESRLSALEAEISRIESSLPSNDETTSGPQPSRLLELISQREALKKAGPLSQTELIYGVQESDQPSDACIQIRGEFTKLGESVPRRNLEILGAEPLVAVAGSGRLQLAQWLIRPDNPLTARVMANRIWQQHFGRGLVATENDFGARGASPTHPELLDWLASQFVAGGWSIKSMHRLIMNSATYQQSSDFDSSAAVRDPEARLLWRFSPRRLSAEEIRDAMLLVSGNLDQTMGCEHPFPAIDTWNFTQHTPFYGDYPTNRRGVYLMQQRLKRHPFLALFDGADTNASTPRRSLTTVPTQSLYLMNSEFVHQQSAGVARKILNAADDESARIERLWQTTLGHSPNKQQLTNATQFLSQYQRALEVESPASPERELTAWSALARTLLTRNEFLFVD